MPSPESGSEWLSLKNIDNQIVVLDNWYLTDATNKKYTIADLTIEPEQSKQIYPSTISLNNDGDIITLYNDQGVQLDIFSYSDSAKGQIISNSPVVTGSIIPSISVNSNSSNYLVNKVVTSAPTIKLEIPQIYYLGEY